MSMNDSNSPTVEASSEDMLFPSFIYNRADGVFVDLPRLQAADGGLERFIDRLFGSGARFFGLDYELFLKLLYDADWLIEMQTKTASLKLAGSIARFPPERQALYRMVKMGEGDKRAEYMFEPVHVEEKYQEPVYGSAGADGVLPVVGYEIKTREIATKLDFDEMVADMWLKGVKFGLREETIRKLIASGDTSRLPIAIHLDPAVGFDAEIIEVCADLHRDNSPKLLANGKANLGVYKNRFPHVGEGTLLLKKVPRKLGKPGRKVTGVIIEPQIPKDLDLHRLSSSGTAVEQREDGEYIVAIMDGFIGIDAKSNRISITEKIETKDGISAKTTGDLALNAEEFIEHGEVQEGRTVKGKHMTFLSDVFGNVISENGNIFISGNVSGGRIESLGGNVVLGSRATRAVILARDGEVTISQCENCLIMGKVVHIERAVNCEIIADELNAEAVEGCVIAGKKIYIKSSGERRGTETLITIMVPDSSASEAQIVSLQNEIKNAQTAMTTKAAEIDVLKADPDFAKFLGLYTRIQSGALKLTEEQALNWQKLVGKNAKAMQQLAFLNKERSTLQQVITGAEEAIVAVSSEQIAQGVGIECLIENVDGHTIGQTMCSARGTAEFNGMTASIIRNKLQTMDASKARLFVGDDGSIDWKLKEISDS